jgi:sorbitol/mannitol transport system permease protein
MNRRTRRAVRGGIQAAALMLLAVAYSFPVLYMVLSSFKPEQDIAPPSLTFQPTLENYQAVINDALLKHFQNSVVISSATVAFALVLGVPVAYTIVYGRLRNPLFHYNWYITTTLLPAVAVIMPIYLILNWLHQLDSIVAMVALYTATGIPLMVWMSTTYMLDIPQSIIEAAEVDGCTRRQSLFLVILPIIRVGLVSTSLLVFIITWNEFLFAVSFTFTQASTLPVYMGRFMTQQGLFWGKMSAAATIVIIVPVILSFIAQKSLVKGLLSGAVKE